MFKLLEYRKHISKLQDKVEKQKSASLSDKTTTFNFNDSGFGGVDVGSDDLWNPHIRTQDANSNFETSLNEERRRNEDIRLQLDNERHLNEQLRHEIERIQQDSKRKEQNYKNTERVSNFSVRFSLHLPFFQNLSQYLSDEQRKMLDLWAELQRVRKQFVALKESTESDLKNQRNEFQQIIRSIQGVTKSFDADGTSIDIFGGRGESRTYNTDTVIIDILRKLRPASDSSTGARNTYGINGDKNDADSELSQEIIKK